MTNDVFRLATPVELVILQIASVAAIRFIAGLTAHDVFADRDCGASRRARRHIVYAQARMAASAVTRIVSSTTLSSVYGVEARVERCSQGRLHIMVDGPANSTEIRHAS